jgi:isocitrate dehydrogenase
VAEKAVVTVIPGDGIGPEVVASAVRLVEATGAPVVWEEARAGASVFRDGVASGVPAATIESLARTRVALKGPLETPVGYGEKSANVTLRKLFETYANVRPVRELPGVPTPYSGRGVDLVVVRENVEDLYAGIEHMQTPDVAQCLKLISRPGCERIVRTAFELARAEGRRSVACATKANIMKLTEGMLKHVFEEIAPDYPEVESWHVIVDNCAHQLVRRPEQFDVIVTTNMNGDILSDLTSGLVGGLGFAPSANLGDDVAIFEAVHGSAPKYAGRDVINPTAMVLSAVLMLRHLGHFEAAEDLEQAVAVTLESGVHTRDVRESDASGTREFTQAVAANLGRRSEAWSSRQHRPLRMPTSDTLRLTRRSAYRSDAGVDVFVESRLAPAELGPALERLVAGTPLALKMVSNRGTRVWPASAGAETSCVDHYRCRFVLRDDAALLTESVVHDLLRRVAGRFRWMHVEKLAELDGQPAYTRAQGED